MGSSTAYHLLHDDGRLEIAVIEPDPTYERASSTLSLANVRIQYSLKQNVQISQHTFEVLGKFNAEMEVAGQRPNINFRSEGNLFLTDAGTREVFDFQEANA